MSYGWAAAQGIPLRRPYYFIELASSFASPEGVIKYPRLAGICGSIDEDFGPLADVVILAITPDVRFWWTAIAEGIPVTIGLTDIEGHWKRFVANVRRPTR